MRAITNTNIMVDDFDYCKEYPKDTFIHFLSHFHADHYEGLSTCWDYSQIYCTAITKQLLLQKFPKVPRITPLELNKKYTFQLNNYSDLKVDVWLFDAYHIPGSVMYLFQGYMGTILHTGDFRYNPNMILENPILFPPSIRTSDLKNCSIQVDEMIFDNTYCNPAFNFPRAEKALQSMIDIIEKNLSKHVLISMGALGKEDICLRLSYHFQTLLIIPEEKSIGTYRTDIFTTKREEGFIEIIKKRHRDKKIIEFKQLRIDFIVISTDFLMLDHKDPDGINYIVPYSLHSNHSEMESLIKAVGPSILRRLVIEIYKLPKFRREQVIDYIKFFKSYVQGLRKRGDGGYSQFKQKFTRIHKLSTEFLYWMEQENQKKLLAKLKLDLGPNKDLRRKYGKELTKEEQEQLDYIEENNLLKVEKKQSISEIAASLKSTHNNRRISTCFQEQKKVLPQQSYSAESSRNLLDDPHLKNLFDAFINAKLFANKSESDLNVKESVQSALERKEM